MNSRPSRQRCLMWKLRLGFGQDLHGHENPTPIRIHHLEFQWVIGKKTLVKSCLGQQWPETIIGVNDLN
jgi:hypothetical protein